MQIIKQGNSYPLTIMFGLDHQYQFFFNAFLGNAEDFNIVMLMYMLEMTPASLWN